MIELPTELPANELAMLRLLIAIGARVLEPGQADTHHYNMDTETVIFTWSPRNACVLIGMPYLLGQVKDIHPMGLPGRALDDTIGSYDFHTFSPQRDIGHALFLINLSDQISWSMRRTAGTNRITVAVAKDGFAVDLLTQDFAVATLLTQGLLTVFDIKEQ